MPSGDSVDSTATTEKPKSHVTDEVRTWRRDFVAAIQADDLARIKLLASGGVTMSIFEFKAQSTLLSTLIRCNWPSIITCKL